jgi:hypothetical protein
LEVGGPCPSPRAGARCAKRRQRSPALEEEPTMAKGQKKSNKEVRKPKKDAGKKGAAKGLGPKT